MLKILRATGELGISKNSMEIPLLQTVSSILG
jgi:hypothetical protein